MGNVEIDNTIQFLDLTGIDEQEQHWLLSTLFSSNERISFPWKSYSQANINGKKYAEIAHVQNGLLNCTDNVSYNKIDIGPQALSHAGSHQTLSDTNRIQFYSVHSKSPTSNVDQLNTTIFSQPNLSFKANDVKGPVISQPGNQSANSLTQDVSHTYINNSINYDGSYEGYNNVKSETTQEFYSKCDNISLENEGISVQTNNNNNIDFKQNGPDERQKSNSINVSTPVNSWASLFNKPKNEKTSENVVRSKPYNFEHVYSQNSNSNDKDKPPKKYIGDPCLHRMGEFFINFTVKNQIISLQPRGLINKSNYCYINSILQALIACPPLYNLFYELSKDSSFLNEKRKNAPVITNVMKFFNEFNHLPADLRINRRIDKNSKKKESKVMINCDPPIEPNYIYKMLNGIRTDTFLVEGRQEDAEEFLGCLLNGLNDEMLELIKIVDDVHNDFNNDKSKTDDNHSDKDKEWQVMGPKNKGSVTRRTEFIKTPISCIFGGSLRSRIHRAGDLSTDNIQPFFTLPLNIEKATSVREALEVLISKNQLEGVTSSRTNQEVEAWQQVTLEQLPIVLILHLKCFDYKMDGCSKIIKVLEFPVDLKIDSKLLSSKNNYTAKEKQYKLFAVVYHDGKEATKGHYITDSYHIGYASWLRYDDSSVKVVLEDQVLKPHGTKVPYLLFYRRSDSVKSK